MRAKIWPSPSPSPSPHTLTSSHPHPHPHPHPHTPSPSHPFQKYLKLRYIERESISDRIKEPVSKTNISVDEEKKEEINPIFNFMAIWNRKHWKIMRFFYLVLNANSTDTKNWSCLIIDPFCNEKFDIMFHLDWNIFHRIKINSTIDLE